MDKRQKKILILRPGAIGDVAHTTIMPVSIKNSHPDYVIHYFTQKEIAPMLQENPYIDKVIEFDRARRKDWGYILSITKELYKEHYDIIFNLTASFRNILISALAFPKKIVFRAHTKGCWVEDFFYSAKSAIPDIEISDRLYLSGIENCKPQIESMLSRYPKPHIMFVVGGRTDKNRQGRIWDIANWSELAERVLKTYGGTIFVCGSKPEREYHNKLSAEKVIVTSGDYDLAGTSTLLSYSDLVISGDTGPIHIASAHNVKTLALLGSTSPDKIKPYGPNGHYISADTDCKYCWKKKCVHLSSDEQYTPCMRAIKVDDVMDKIADIL